MTVAINVGTRFPAYATSMGRVMLAAQPQGWIDNYLATNTFASLTPSTVTDAKKLATVLRRVAREGYALVDQELEVGLRSIAVPVRGADGSVVAAMNTSIHVSRGDAEAVRRDLLPPLRAAAAAVEADLVGGRTPSGPA
jgi:IclR family pca regulon transcriptional regulator